MYKLRIDRGVAQPGSASGLGLVVPVTDIN